MTRLSKALLLFPIIIFSLNGCTESIEDGLPVSESTPSYYHSTGWKDDPQHASDYSTNPQNCKACHGDDLEGGASGISCADCHHGWSGSHGDAFNENPDSCKPCHGDSITSCADCHHSETIGFDCAHCHVDIAGPYTNSAHGNTIYGVNRLGTGYATGDCTHCHDLSDPIASENELILFAPYSSASQTDNFCFQCHSEAGSVQDPPFANYNYSYMASGDSTITCPDDILEAFSFIDESGSSVSNCGSDYGTSHKLTDIKTFINGKWGYTADSNPCTACHNPHPAQRDLHTAGNRGSPVSLPSDHTDTSTWELWGDNDSERMEQYATSQGGIYQAPNALSGYEPDGSDTTDGSNLTDYVTFCTDCHNNSNIIYSNVLGRDLYTIDWGTEKHGSGVAGDCGPRLRLPYVEGQCGSYVLACTDCHEPHGSPNIFLTRQKVNNGDVTVLTGTGEGPGGMECDSEWVYLCAKCHYDLTGGSHAHPSYLPPDTAGCSSAACHFWNGCTYRPCADCHYHGNSNLHSDPYGEYGEPLF